MNDRTEFLEALRKMPDEAFGYVVLACKDVVERNEANHGFTIASTRGFIDLAFGINRYIGSDLIDMTKVRQHNPMLFSDEKPPASTEEQKAPLSTEKVNHV
jgi:hypothetical protein